MKKTIYFFLVTLFLLPHSAIYADTLITNYIVIGAGTAGAVVANRLSITNQVVVIHNGKNQIQNPLIALTENAFVTVPTSLVGPPFYQTGTSTPQPNLNNRSLPWVVAVPLGGASSINGSGYVRGTLDNYKQWQAVAGPLWSYTRIAQIYKSLEAYHGTTPDPTNRGYFGPVSIFQVPHPTRVAQTFTDAISAATPYPPLVDYNDFSASPFGASAQMQFTAAGNNGEFRVSSASAFLNGSVVGNDGKGVNGHNLKILYESTALRIIFNGRIAIGVEYYRRGKINRVYASKGIIISAGLKSSPLLMHSGIGPKKLLYSLGIPVVFDNPNVGKNLIDDVFIILGFTSNPNDTPISFGSPVLAPLNTTLSLISQNPIRKKTMSLLNIPPMLTQISDDNGIFKQIAFLPDPANVSNRQFLFSAINPVPGVTLALFYLVQPTSRGYVTINSNNPLAPPVINFGMLNAADLALFIRGFQLYIPAINNKLSQLDPSYGLFWPDPNIIGDTPTLTQFILENAVNSMHFQGHCRMAPLAQGGVVDGHGRVYGVTNLYVADNSILPFPMDGTPMATGYLVGENISRIILGT